MRRILLATAIVAGAAFFGTAQAALTPWVFTDAVTGLSDVTATGIGARTDNIPDNNILSGKFNLFTLNPGANCSGSYCSGGLHTGTVNELLAVNFTGMSILGKAIADFSLTGTYIAKYSGAELACAVGDGVSPSSGQTDCFLWTGATSADYKGKLVLDKAITGTSKILEITLFNATDWSITPTVTAQLIDTPEPATLAILGVGLLGLAVARRRV